MKKTLQIIFYIPVSILIFYLFLLFNDFITYVMLPHGIASYASLFITSFFATYLSLETGEKILPDFKDTLYTKLCLSLLVFVMLIAFLSVVYFSYQEKKYFNVFTYSIISLLLVILLLDKLKKDF